MGFKIKTEGVVDNSVPESTVIRMDPPSGTSVAYGSTVTIYYAISTALFVMGRERAMAFYESGAYAFEAVLIGHDGEITVTDGFKDRFFENH